MTTSERIAEVVTPVVTRSGHDLYDVELTGATVRVVVDGATLDDLEKLTPDISAALDAADPLPDRWYLEVSSPGLERTLRTPAHYAAAVGDKVKIRAHPGAGTERRLEGILESADADGVVVDGRRLAYADIERARTVFEWGPPPRPGRPRKKRSAT
jgi:ribosome maturation factor RimP